MRKEYLFILALISIAVAFVSGCSTTKKSHTITLSHEDSLALDQKQWMKDYAFCMCLFYGKNKDTVISHDISFSILNEISDYPLQEYQKIDSLAKNFALSITPTQIADYNNQKPVLFRCLEFHRSKSVDSIVNSMKK